MLKYCLRRILQMIPTVFGVILITFVLFNVAGGSPAAMTLGKNVTAKMLEDFDEERGFNKPLFVGWWAHTRAYNDALFKANAGRWEKLKGVTYSPPDKRVPGHIVLVSGTYDVPLEFDLHSNSTYRFTAEYRTRGPAQASFVSYDSLGKPLLAVLPDSPAWRRAKLTFVASAAAVKMHPALEVKAGSLEIRSMTLDRQMRHPFDSQLAFYLRQLAHLDFGVSTATNQRVSTLLLNGIWPSLILMIPIFFGELILSVAIALICGFLRNSLTDRLFVMISVALMSINYLIWIVGGQYIFAYKLRWFPIWGFESWVFLQLPWAIGIISGLGSGIRFYRTIVLDEMYKEYVRTAFAKGVSRGGALFRHVLKNAMIPIITDVVITLPFLYAGSLLLESFFGIPGLGYLSVFAINSSDVDVVRAIVFVGAILFVGANLISDICYALVDPRVKLR